MMICNECGLTFCGHDSLKGIGGYCCPSCHSEEIAQAARCAGCGEYFHVEELLGARCRTCSQDLKFKFLIALKNNFTGSFSKKELMWLTDHVYPDLIKALMARCVEHM